MSNILYASDILMLNVLCTLVHFQSIYVYITF